MTAWHTNIHTEVSSAVLDNYLQLSVDLIAEAYQSIGSACETSAINILIQKKFTFNASTAQDLTPFHTVCSMPHGNLLQVTVQHELVDH